MSDSADVVVVGAGVVGCSVAYYLARQGATVLILEREAIGSGASTHATGSLSLLGIEFTPGPTFQLALVGYREFLDLVPRLEEETGSDLLYQRRPSLRLALDEEEEKHIKGSMTWQEEFVAMHWAGPDEILSLEPRLTSRVVGGVYEDESAQLNSYRLTLALASAAERFGARLLLREVTGLVTQPGRVTGVVTSDGEVGCDTVVVAAGVWSAAFGEWLGSQVPVRALKGERLILRYQGAPLPVLITSPKRGHMISTLDGLLSVGSTGGRDYDRRALFVDDGFDRMPTEAAQLELLGRAIDVLPDLEEAELVQQLAGSRPLSPDRMPIIGPVSGWDGIMLATGHTTKGVHLGPITGRAVADYILKGRTDISVEMDAFLPSRFNEDSNADFYASGREVEE